MTLLGYLPVRKKISNTLIFVTTMYSNKQFYKYSSGFCSIIWYIFVVFRLSEHVEIVIAIKNHITIRLNQKSNIKIIEV